MLSILNLMTKVYYNMLSIHVNELLPSARNGIKYFGTTGYDVLKIINLGYPAEFDINY